MAPSLDFVTSAALDSRLTALFEQVQSLLQERLSSPQVSTLQIAASTVLTPVVAPPQPVAADLVLPAPLPACSDAYQHPFSWLASDLVAKVHNDTLSIYELPRLGDPSWPTALPDEMPSLLVAGVSAIPQQTPVSASNQEFLKDVPSVATFGRLWFIYSSLRASSSPDRNLISGLGAFDLHISELAEAFPWPKVVDYLIAACSERLGKVPSQEWSHLDYALRTRHFQELSRNVKSSRCGAAKRSAPNEDDVRREQTCIKPSPPLIEHLWTDACMKGYGAHWGPMDRPIGVFAAEVPSRHRTKDIHFLEALAVLEALRFFSPRWQGPRLVIIHVDNTNAERGIRSGSSRDPLTQALLREIFGFCFHHQINLCPVRVASVDNQLADFLSRRRFRTILQRFPCAYNQLFPDVNSAKPHPNISVRLSAPALSPPSSSGVLPSPASTTPNPTPTGFASSAI